MEARIFRAALLVLLAASLGASHRTQNFIVTAPSEPLARQVAEAAERYRRDLAIEWLGHELPPWRDPCPITVRPEGGAGGVTSFMFDQGRPFGWRMTVQGPPERILDSVLPHEVTHTIFATHFGRPLPRWADEGACTTVEHASERQKQHELLIRFLTSQPSRGIPFNQMFRMMDYPRDMLPLYAQGYSVTKYLIAQGGRRTFIQYLDDGMKSGDWPAATRRHYGFQNLSELQVTWLEWVRSGSPQDVLAAGFGPSGGAQLAGGTAGNPPGGQVQPASYAASGELAGNGGGDSDGGWYARQRDLAQASARSQPSGRPADATQHQSTTRPQPIGTPQQQVIAPPGSQFGVTKPEPRIAAPPTFTR